MVKTEPSRSLALKAEITAPLPHQGVSASQRRAHGPAGSLVQERFENHLTLLGFHYEAGCGHASARVGPGSQRRARDVFRDGGRIARDDNGCAVIPHNGNQHRQDLFELLRFVMAHTGLAARVSNFPPRPETQGREIHAFRRARLLAGELEQLRRQAADAFGSRQNLLPARRGAGRSASSGFSISSAYPEMIIKGLLRSCARRAERLCRAELRSAVICSCSSSGAVRSP